MTVRRAVTGASFIDIPAGRASMIDGGVVAHTVRLGDGALCAEEWR